MKTKAHSLLLPAMIAGLSTTTVQAAPFLPGKKVGIDYGPTPTANWNNFSGNGSKAAGTVVHLDGSVSDLLAMTVSNGSFFNNDGTDNWIGLQSNPTSIAPNPKAPPEFVDSVTTDLAGNSTSFVSTPVRLVVTGLNPYHSYKVDSVSTATSGNSTTQSMRVIGGSTYGPTGISRSATVSQGLFHRFASVLPTSGGQLTFESTGNGFFPNPIANGTLIEALAPTPAGLLDNDNDGMPNWWEAAYGFNPANGADGGAADSDGDGVSNLDEFLGGSNPRQAFSVPGVPIWVVNGDGSWNSPVNWSPTGVPNGQNVTARLLSDALTTAAGATIALDIPVTLGQLEVAGSNPFTLSAANTLTFSTTAPAAFLTTWPDTGSSLNILGNVVLASPLLVTTGATSAITIGGTLSETGGSRAITHSGSGSLTLAGTNTFSGGIVVKSEATLIAGNDLALGSTAQATALTIEDGGTLNVGNSLLNGYGVGSIKVRGAGVDGNGAIVKSTGSNFNVFNGELDFTGDTKIRNDRRLDFDGPLANSTGARVTLTKTGAQTLFLANSIVGSGFDWDIRQGQITMEGSIDSSVNSSFKVNAGAILQKDRNNYNVAGSLVLSGGTIKTDGNAHTWNFTGGLLVTEGGVINPSGASAVMNFSGALSGGGSIMVGSLGTVNFSGTASGHTGGIVLDSGGRLVINGNYSTSTGTIRIRSGATLSGSGTWGGNVIIEQGGTLVGSSLAITGTVSNAPLTFTALSEVAGLSTLPSQWKFYWNAPTGWAVGNPGDLSSGAVTDRTSWKPMVWSGSLWTADGNNAADNPPSDFLRISATGGHTGTPGARLALDRYAISEFTVSQPGDYRLLLGKIATEASGNGVLVKIFLNGAQYDAKIAPNNSNTKFSYILNGLAANDEIAVAVGANGDGSFDTFALDYRIALLKPEYASPHQIHVADYGAVGNGVTDDGPAVLEAIRAWKNVSGPAALHFEEDKTYYLGERPDNKAYFILNGLNDKVVEGNDAKLIFHPSNRGFAIEGCDHIVVRNFSVDYSSLPFSQGVITSTNAAAGTFIFRPSDGYPAPIREGNKTWGSVYDPATQNLRQGVSDNIQMSSLTDLGNGSFEFIVQPNPPAIVGNIAGIMQNDLFVFRAYLDKGIPGSGDWSKITNNGTVAFENVNLQCAPAFVFGMSGSTKPCLFRKVNISPPPDTDRLVSSFGDGFHCNANRFGPIIEEGHFTYLMDDTIHIKSTGIRINGVSNNTITLGTGGHRVGDVFRFLNDDGSILWGNATVTAINGSGITLDALPPEVQQNHFIFNLNTNNEGFLIQNNTFGKKRRAAALLRGGGGQVLNNVADGNSGFWVWENVFFLVTLEGTRAENILFQGNTIRNCAWGIWIQSGTSKMPMDNIRIIDNVFGVLSSTRRGLEISDATNLQILGNQFQTTPIAKLDSVENVTMGFNTDVNGDSLLNNTTPLSGSYDPAEINFTNLNVAPVFTADPMSRADATEDAGYTGQTLAGSAADVNPESTLTYAKVSGPAWLSIAANGALSGTPANSDVGANSWTVQVSDGLGGTDTAALNITVDPFDYDDWAAQAGLFGASAAMTYDADFDGLNNLLEYALDGNPTQSDSATVLPTFELSQDGAWLYYVHKQRVHDSSLVYTVQTSTDLTGTSWTTNGIEMVSESAVVNHFKTVTTRTAVGDRVFMRLKIER